MSNIVLIAIKLVDREVRVRISKRLVSSPALAAEVAFVFKPAVGVTPPPSLLISGISYGHNDRPILY